MIEAEKFRIWLKSNTNYSSAVVRDMVSRMKRADSLLPWDGSETYIFYLGETPAFKSLTVSVRSQLRKAVKAYSQFNKASE